MTDLKFIQCVGGHGLVSSEQGCYKEKTRKSRQCDIQGAVSNRPGFRHQSHWCPVADKGHRERKDEYGWNFKP